MAESESIPICPHCGADNRDVVDGSEFEGEEKCRTCGKRFGYTMTITYETYTEGVEQDEPKL